MGEMYVCVWFLGHLGLSFNMVYKAWKHQNNITKEKIKTIRY